MMVNGVPGCLSTGPQASQTHCETARELLRRNRRLFGILKRVHCRRNRGDCEEVKVESDPDALVKFFKALAFPWL